MPHPSIRLQIVDELGFPQRVAAGHETVNRAPGNDWLILGLGPDPGALAASLPSDARVSYLECPALFDQAGDAWRQAIPASWQRVDSFDPLADRNMLLAKAGPKLFPGFWAPIQAALLLPQPAPAGKAGRRTCLLAASPGSTIAPDVAWALGEEGWVARSVEQPEVLRYLEDAHPDLFLSINFTGLDRYGEFQAVLARAGVPTAVWCVDNPFLSLSGVKTNAWKELTLFVTDDWFLEPLRELGAHRVHHLPLGAARHFFGAEPDRPELAEAFLYVGNSAVADKELFFSGRSIREERLGRARDLLAAGGRPDFGWWVDELAMARLWPGLQARSPGLGAEEATRAWRVAVLDRAAATGRLVVCGDEAWRDLLDGSCRFLPSVRYRGALPGLYASARFVIGAASLLLPHGLSQRHFDVWAAGGCLLTDNSPGLALFPRELVAPITYHTAQAVVDVARALEAERGDLMAAWRDLIGREHTYRNRVRHLLGIMG